MKSPPPPLTNWDYLLQSWQTESKKIFQAVMHMSVTDTPKLLWSRMIVKTVMIIYQQLQDAVTIVSEIFFLDTSYWIQHFCKHSLLVQLRTEVQKWFLNIRWSQENGFFGIHDHWNGLLFSQEITETMVQSLSCDVWLIKITVGRKFCSLFFQLF